MRRHIVHTDGAFGRNGEHGRLLFRVPQANIEANVRRALARVAFCRFCDTRGTGMMRPIWSASTHVMVERTQSVVGAGNRILFARGARARYADARGHGSAGAFLGDAGDARECLTLTEHVFTDTCGGSP